MAFFIIIIRSRDAGGPCSIVMPKFHIGVHSVMANSFIHRALCLGRLQLFKLCYYVVLFIEFSPFCFHLFFFIFFFFGGGGGFGGGLGGCGLLFLGCFFRGVWVFLSDFLLIF